MECGSTTRSVCSISTETKHGSGSRGPSRREAASRAWRRCSGIASYDGSARESRARMLIHVIADYGPGDLAYAEVAQRIKLRLPDAEPLYTPVPAFATLAAGFCVAQLGLNPTPPNTLIYHNVAPRKDDEEARAGNEGERLA